MTKLSKWVKTRRNRYIKRFIIGILGLLGIKPTTLGILKLVKIVVLLGFDKEIVNKAQTQIEPKINLK